MTAYATHKAPSKGERKQAHAYKVHAFHTHTVASRKRPERTVEVRCSRLNCRGIA